MVSIHVQAVLFFGFPADGGQMLGGGKLQMKGEVNGRQRVMNRKGKAYVDFPISADLFQRRCDAAVHGPPLAPTAVSHAPSTVDDVFVAHRAYTKAIITNLPCCRRGRHWDRSA